MLEETGVAATPGVDFDEARGSRFVRFSYSGTTADMAEAVRAPARLVASAPIACLQLDATHVS